MVIITPFVIGECNDKTFRLESASLPGIDLHIALNFKFPYQVFRKIIHQLAKIEICARCVCVADFFGNEDKSSEKNEMCRFVVPTSQWSAMWD